MEWTRTRRVGLDREQILNRLDRLRRKHDPHIRQYGITISEDRLQGLFEVRAMGVHGWLRAADRQLTVEIERIPLLLRPFRGRIIAGLEEEIARCFP